MKRLAAPVLAHRLVPAHRHVAGIGSDTTAQDLVVELVESIPVPE